MQGKNGAARTSESPEASEEIEGEHQRQIQVTPTELDSRTLVGVGLKHCFRLSLRPCASAGDALQSNRQLVFPLRSLHELRGKSRCVSAFAFRQPLHGSTGFWAVLLLSPLRLCAPAGDALHCEKLVQVACPSARYASRRISATAGRVNSSGIGVPSVSISLTFVPDKKT